MQRQHVLPKLTVRRKTKVCAGVPSLLRGRAAVQLRGNIVHVLWKFYQINTAHTFVILTNKVWLCDFFSSSFYPPLYFAHRFISFPVTCDIYFTLLQERERLWRLAEVRGLVMDLGTCCLVPCLPTHPMDWKRFDEVRKADYVCCETLLFLRRTTCYFQHPTAPSSD